MRLCVRCRGKFEPVVDLCSHCQAHDLIDLAKWLAVGNALNGERDPAYQALKQVAGILNKGKRMAILEKLSEDEENCIVGAGPVSKRERRKSGDRRKR